jgi:SAM-dependent methyltransferase
MIAEFTDPRLVAIYESVNAYEPGTQPDFYSQLAAELGAETIVDLGCGTGLISRRLAAEGYRVIGGDPSPAMLALARSGPLGDRVRWIEGSASRLGAAGADLAIMAGHAAQFFLCDEAWHDALSALHAALRLGGHLAFETRNPEAREWEAWTAEARFSCIDTVAGRIEFWSEAREIREEILSYTNHYLFAATGEVIIAEGSLRFRPQDELARSLVAHGFTVRDVYGWWDWRPVSRTAPELIVVASAA